MKAAWIFVVVLFFLNGYSETNNTESEHIKADKMRQSV
jgi:hypothetical protein